MARLYKSSAVLFLSLIGFFQGALCVNNDIQTVKIVNATKSELTYTHTLPGKSVTYIHIVSFKFARAQINNWHRASHGTERRARERDISHPLPTYIRIAFSQKVSQIFVDDFFETLRAIHPIFRRIHPIRHGKFRDQFMIQVGPYYTWDEIKMFIEKANIAMYKKWLKEQV